MNRRELLMVGLMACANPRGEKDGKRVIQSIRHDMLYLDARKTKWPFSYLREVGMKYNANTIPLFEKNRNFTEVITSFFAEPAVVNSVNIYVEDTRFNYFNIVTVTAKDIETFDKYRSHLEQLSDNKYITIEMERGGKCKTSGINRG